MLKAALKRLVKTSLQKGLRPTGYQLVNPDHRYGIDYLADTRRLSRAYGIDVDVIFDVGANVGRSSLAFRSAWPNAKLYAFEPTEALIDTLRANLKADPSVIIEQIALGRAAGRSRFYTVDDSPDLNSLHDRTPYTERFGTPAKVQDVEVATLDDFCRRANVDHISILKIDTEGSDYDVLLGASEYLKHRKIDFVYCEFNSLNAAPDALGSLLPIAHLLGSFGYNFIASYNDYIVTDERFFLVSNALFAADRAPPRRTTA